MTMNLHKIFKLRIHINDIENSFDENTSYSTHKSHGILGVYNYTRYSEHYLKTKYILILH